MKKKKKRPKYFLLILTLLIYITYQYLSLNPIINSQKDLVNFILSKEKTTNLFKDIKTLFKTKNILSSPYKKTTSKKEEIKTISITKEPIIYIYNTHQTEEYQPSSFVEYSITPTVQMNDYILEEQFEKEGLETLVEEQSIKEVLNNNNWNYARSYDASRIFLEEKKKMYPSLTYFIDVHRDSLTKEKTTITINNKDYAKILFIVGLENPNYHQNLAFTESINNKLNEKYPNLSKGIYKKEGSGVNGVYNQDFSPKTILVEMGGPENSIEEVLNTSLAFSECFLEVINNEI